MSKALRNVEAEDLDAADRAPWRTALNAPTLLAWLDESPSFVERTRNYRRRYTNPDDGLRSTITVERPVTEMVYVGGEYEFTDRKSHSNQRDVLDAWLDRKFPTHNIVDEDRGTAAELYTLASYTTGVEGPSVRGRRGMRRRGRTERPGAAFSCTECNWQSMAFDPDRTGRWSNADDRREAAQSHLTSAHPDSEDATFTRITGHRTTESEKNYAAYQRLDGAGWVRHYDRIAALRTRYGVVLANRQDFAKGRARVTRPGRDERDAYVPLTGMVNYLDQHDGADETVFDIVDVDVHEYEQSSSRGSYTYTRSWYTLWFDTGAAFLVAYDETAQDHHERRCGFYVPPGEADQFASLTDPQQTLRPVEVDAHLQRHDDAEVVGAQDYTQANGYGHGGKFYTEDRLGRDVIRQGEWYFVPLAADIEAALDSFDGIDSAPDRRVHVSANDLPRECDSCGEATFDYRPDGIVECNGCESLWFVESLNRTMRDENPLGSHIPNEVLEIEGHTFVRGMIRHTDRDHNAINLDDVWHLAVDNGRDGVVFDTSTPENASGRAGANAGAGMRVE